MRLRIRFVDGTSGQVELAAFLASEEVDGTIFEPLREPDFFGRVAVDEFGAVCWPNGADLAPDALYRQVTGAPVGAR